MPDVSGTEEELQSQGYTTEFEPQGSWFQNYLKTLPPPPPQPDPRAQREQAAQDFGAAGGEFGAGLTKGLLGVGESAAGLGEIVPGSIPVVGKYVKPIFKDIGDYLAETARAIPTNTPSVTDVQSAGDFAKYTEAQLGQLTGFIAPTIVLSLLSGGTSLEVAAGKSLADEMSIGLSKDLASKLVQGGFIASEIGSTYRGIRDATGKEAPFTSLVAGTASGLLLNSGALPIVKEFLDGASTDAKRQFLRGYMVDALNAAAKHGAFLGGATAGSHTIHLLANKFADSTYDLVNSQNLVGITDSFLSGLIGGGVIGGGGRALRGPSRVREAGLGAEAAESGLGQVVAPAAEPSLVDQLVSRDRQGRARAAEEARMGADLAMERPPSVEPPGPVYPPGSPPPDSGIEAALASAASSVSKAAEISAEQANALSEASRPVAEAIVKAPNEPVPAEAQAAADRAMEEASRHQEPPKPAFPPGSEPPEAGIKPRPTPEVAKEVAPEVKTAPEPTPEPTPAPEPAKPPKPTPAERQAIAKQAKDRNSFLKEVGGHLKRIARMGPGQLDVADAELVKALAKWHGKVPDDMLDAGIKQVAAALRERVKESNPDVGGLLTDANGKETIANLFFNASTGKVLIREGKQTVYTSKKTFSSMKEFEKERDALISDSSNWERNKNGKSWLFHDAPFTSSDREQWVAGLLYHLRKKDKVLADAVEQSLSSNAISPDHLLGLIGAHEHIEEGKARRVYPNRLTPSKAAELLPASAYDTLEKDYQAAKVAPVEPEDVANLSEEEITALGQKTERQKFLLRAKDKDPEALQEWLSSGRERRVSEPIAKEKDVKAPKTKEVVDDDAVAEELGKATVETSTAAAVKYADSVDALFEDHDLGSKAGELVFRASTDGGVDKVLFIDQLTGLLSQNGATKAKAAEIAAIIYSDADGMREGGQFHGRLAEGIDHTPQTSAENPIVHATAVGLQQILSLVADQRFGFSGPMREFTQRFLAQVDPMYLDGLTLMAVSKIGTDGKAFVTYEGTFEPLLRIAKVALNSRNPDVIAHEISHNLYYYLPESLRQRVDVDWRRAVEQQINRETDPTAVEMLRDALKRGGLRRDFLGRIASKGDVITVHTSDGKPYKVRFDGHWDLNEMGMGNVPQVTALEDIPGVTVKGSSHMIPSLLAKGVKFPEEVLGKIADRQAPAVNSNYQRLYHLTNAEEYFVKRLLEKTNPAEPVGIWGHIKDFIGQIANVFKGLMGGDRLWDEIANGFRDGTFEPRYQVWARNAEKLGSASRNQPEFEKNIRRSPTAAHRVLEATSAMAQSLSLSRVAERIADTLNASPRARRLSGLSDDLQIAKSARDYTDPRTYAENRIRLGEDTPQWKTIADDTYKKYRGREIKLQALRGAEVNQRAYLESEQFRKKLGKKADLEARIEALREQQHETLKTTLAETIKADQAILAQGKLEEGRAAQLRNEIAALEGIVKNKVGGLEQLINHIVNVVSLSPDGRALLFGKEVKGAEILKAYESVAGRVDAGLEGELKFDVPYEDLELSDKEVKRLEAQANQLRRPSQALYSIAADVIARQLDVSQQLAAAELVRNNPALYDEYANQFSETNLKLISQNPDAFAAKMAKSLASAGKKEGVLAAAVSTVNRHMVTKVNKLVDTLHAIAIIDSTLKDRDVAATYKLAAEDSKQVLTPPVWAMKALRPDTLVQKRKFVLPDKSEIAVDFSVNEKTVQEHDKVADAAGKIWDYMQSEEGQNDPYLAYWDEQYRVLHSIYASDLFLGIVKTREPVTFGFGEIRWTVPQIQTRQGNLATIEATNWEHAVKAFGHWILDHGDRDIKLPLFEAAKSHPELGKFPSAGDAVVAWRKAIGSELTGRANAIGEAWRVGDAIGNGHTVTAEDLALLGSMVKAVDAAFNLTPQKGRSHLMVKQYVSDSLGTLREPLKKNPWLLPANFNRDMVNFARLVNSITEGKAVESLTPERRAELEKAYDEYFHDAVKPFLDDTEVLVDVGVTNFPIEAYRSAYEQVKAGEITDFAGLVRHMTGYAIGDEIHSDWVAEKLAGELTKQASIIYEATRGAEPESKFMALDSYNSFTLARGKRVANYGFYEYGLFDDVAIRNFADDGASFYFDRFRKSLDAAREELSQMVSRIDAKNQGVIKGEAYTEYQELKAKLRDVTGLIATLDHAEGKFGRYQSMDIPRAGRRVMNTLVTAAIANPVTGMGDLSGNWIRTVELMMTMFGRRALNPSWNLAFGKAVAKGAVLAVKGAYGGTVAGVRGFLKPGPLQEKAARALESAVEAIADAPFLKEMAKTSGKHAQFLRDMAAFDYYHKVDPIRVGNKWRSPKTGGAIYEVKGDPESITRKMAGWFNGPASIVGALVDATADTLYRGFNITGDLGISSVAHAAMDSVRLQLARTFENLGEDGLRRQFNLDKPNDPKNVVHASMILSDGATNSNLSHFATLTKLAGFSHNEMAIDYWKRLAATDPAKRNDVPLLTPDQMALFTRKIVEDINQPTVSNRAMGLKKTAFGRLMYPLMGWSWNAAAQTAHWFGRAVSDPQRSTQQLRYAQLVMVGGLLALAGASAIANEEMMRKFYRWFLDEVKPGRQPWEAGTTQGALKRTLIAMSTILPVFNVVPNIMFNDVPGSAAQGIDVFLQNKVKDVLGYVSGALASNDPTYGLADLIRRTFPVLRPAINRLTAYHGTLELRNASRLLQRYAPDELRRPAGGPIGATTATELTPFGRRMANAAMNGDVEGLKKIYAEAVAKATEMGRPDPERVVQQLYEAQNPVRSALKSAPSAEQWDAIISQMGGEDRAAFEDSIEKYQAGGEAIGVRAGFQRGGGEISALRPGSTGGGARSAGSEESPQPTSTNGMASAPIASLPIQGGRSRTLVYGPPLGALQGTVSRPSRLRLGSGPVHGGIAHAGMGRAGRALRGRLGPGLRRAGARRASLVGRGLRLRVGKLRKLRL